MLCGFTRRASTMRRRNWASVSREPTPAKEGPRLPNTGISETGAAWQMVQLPLAGSVAMRRPFWGSPGVPVSRTGMASPTMRNFVKLSVARADPIPIVAMNIPIRAYNNRIRGLGFKAMDLGIAWNRHGIAMVNDAKGGMESFRPIGNGSAASRGMGAEVCRRIVPGGSEARAVVKFRCDWSCVRQIVRTERAASIRIDWRAPK